MSTPQIIYATWLALLFVSGKHRFTVLVVTANMVAILAACGLMDIGAVDRDRATGLMMVADVATGATLAWRAGVSRVVAWGYAATVPLYSASLIFGYSEIATSALVYVVAYAQLGIISVGKPSDRARNNHDIGSDLRFSPLVGIVSHQISGRGMDKAGRAAGVGYFGAPK